jgi:hypothetical protein
MGGSAIPPPPSNGSPSPGGLNRLLSGRNQAEPPQKEKTSVIDRAGNLFFDYFFGPIVETIVTYLMEKPWDMLQTFLSNRRQASHHVAIEQAAQGDSQAFKKLVAQVRTYERNDLTDDADRLATRLIDRASTSFTSVELIILEFHCNPTVLEKLARKCPDLGRQVIESLMESIASCRRNFEKIDHSHHYRPFHGPRDSAASGALHQLVQSPLVSLITEQDLRDLHQFAYRLIPTIDNLGTKFDKTRELVRKKPSTIGVIFASIDIYNQRCAERYLREIVGTLEVVYEKRPDLRQQIHSQLFAFTKQHTIFTG